MRWCYSALIPFIHQYISLHWSHIIQQNRIHAFILYWCHLLSHFLCRSSSVFLFSVFPFWFSLCLLIYFLSFHFAILNVDKFNDSTKTKRNSAKSFLVLFSFRCYRVILDSTFSAVWGNIFLIAFHSMVCISLTSVRLSFLLLDEWMRLKFSISFHIFQNKNE